VRFEQEKSTLSDIKGIKLCVLWFHNGLSSVISFVAIAKAKFSAIRMLIVIISPVFMLFASMSSPIFDIYIVSSVIVKAFTFLILLEIVHLDYQVVGRTILWVFF
jgi:hypothetical protein